MGLFKQKHSGVVNETVVLYDPNPENFRVKDCHRIGNHWVSKINYPDARNFEGDKILLTTWNPLSRSIIDPHFTDGGGILARFEPTKLGWELAIKTANLLVDKT